METRSGIFFIDHQRSGFGSHVCPQVPGTGSERLVATGTYACGRSATTDPENLVLTSAAIRVKSVGSVKNVEYVKSAVGSAYLEFRGCDESLPTVFHRSVRVFGNQHSLLPPRDPSTRHKTFGISFLSR